MNIEPTSHTFARVGHAVWLVGGLIPFTCDPTLPHIVEIACLEDWFTNYRLLIEFLIIGGRSNCASATDLVADWSPQTENEAALRRDYGIASESVSHVGRARPSEDGEIDLNRPGNPGGSNP